MGRSVHSRDLARVAPGCPAWCVDGNLCHAEPHRHRASRLGTDHGRPERQRRVSRPECRAREPHRFPGSGASVCEERERPDPPTRSRSTRRARTRARRERAPARHSARRAPAGRRCATRILWSARDDGGHHYGTTSATRLGATPTPGELSMTPALDHVHVGDVMHHRRDRDRGQRRRGQRAAGRPSSRRSACRLTSLCIAPRR
jgi:hypothetical protein